jgi:hypothetical protein
VEVFIRHVLEREVVDDGAAHAAAAPGRSEPLDQILEPVRREFEESRMTEEELVRFLSEVRDVARKDRRERKAP